MPVTVVVRTTSDPKESGNPPALTFDGTRIVIGRSNGSDVRLPDPSVSQRHASIRAQGTEFAIVDEGSTNGTWVGGVKLGPQTPRLVKSGDLVRIGRVWIEITIGQNAPTPELGLATRDLALALVRRAMDAAGDDTCTTVHVSEGPDIGASLRLVEEGRAYVIGRAERCDLPLADEDASREHVSVARRGGRVYLRDLGSKNGVELGVTRLADGQEIVWRSPTMVRVGMSVLSLDEPVTRALAELEAASDEAFSDDDAPPAPPSTTEPKAATAEPEPVIPEEGAVQAAPVAASPRTAPTVPSRKRRRVWTPLDLIVVSIAVAVILASLVGLVWVLR